MISSSRGMASHVQKVSAVLSGGAPSSPRKELPSEMTRPKDIDAGHMTLANYLKKELGEVINERVGAKIEKVEKFKAAAQARGAAFQQFNDEIVSEKVERKEWQEKVDTRIDVAESRAIG